MFVNWRNMRLLNLLNCILFALTLGFSIGDETSDNEPGHMHIHLVEYEEKPTHLQYGKAPFVSPYSSLGNRYYPSYSTYPYSTYSSYPSYSSYPTSGSYGSKYYYYDTGKHIVFTTPFIKSYLMKYVASKKDDTVKEVAKLVNKQKDPVLNIVVNDYKGYPDNFMEQKPKVKTEEVSVSTSTTSCENNEGENFEPNLGVAVATSTGNDELNNVLNEVNTMSYNTPHGETSEEIFVPNKEPNGVNIFTMNAANSGEDMESGETQLGTNIAPEVNIEGDGVKNIVVDIPPTYGNSEAPIGINNVNGAIVNKEEVVPILEAGTKILSDVVTNVLPNAEAKIEEVNNVKAEGHDEVNKAISETISVAIKTTGSESDSGVSDGANVSDQVTKEKHESEIHTDVNNIKVHEVHTEVNKIKVNVDSTENHV